MPTETGLPWLRIQKDSFSYPAAVVSNWQCSMSTPVAVMIAAWWVLSWVSMPQ